MREPKIEMIDRVPKISLVLHVEIIAERITLGRPGVGRKISTSIRRWVRLARVGSLLERTKRRSQQNRPAPDADAPEFVRRTQRR